MFDAPTTSDLYAALKELIEDTQIRSLEIKSRIQSESYSNSKFEGDRELLAAAIAIDDIHRTAVTAAKKVLIDFSGQMRKPAGEVAERARPLLEALNEAVLRSIPAVSQPRHRDITTQYQAAFQQRIDDTIRAIAIGYVKGTGFMTSNPNSPDEWISAVNRRPIVPPYRRPKGPPLASCPGSP